MYLLHWPNASGGGSREIGLFVVVPQKLRVMFVGKSIVGAAGVGVGRVALVWDLHLVGEDVAGLRRTCGGSLESGVLSENGRQHPEPTP